jgi:hypothetical protein
MSHFPFLYQFRFILLEKCGLQQISVNVVKNSVSIVENQNVVNGSQDIPYGGLQIFAVSFHAPLSTSFTTTANLQCTAICTIYSFVHFVKCSHQSSVFLLQNLSPTAPKFSNLWSPPLISLMQGFWALFVPWVTLRLLWDIRTSSQKNAFTRGTFYLT